MAKEDYDLRRAVMFLKLVRYSYSSGGKSYACQLFNIASLFSLPGNMLLGLGIMLAANEVPRIAQQFGLDSSVRVNMMSVVHATTTAVNLTRSVARAAK